MAYAVGVDLGGTKTEAIVLERATLRELARKRIATQKEGGYDAIVSRTAALVRSVVDDAGVTLDQATVGMGVPGHVSRITGLLKNSNVVCMNGQPFQGDLRRELGAPVAFENDANCFALAETLAGAASPYREGVVFGVIMGTGVGGGVILRGETWPGPQGIGGEWGHHAVWGGRADARPCYCGQSGCLERYASGPALERDYEERAGARLTVPEIVARRPTDEHARAVMETFLESFGRGLANLIDILDPSCVVLGGGLSNLPLLLTEGRERVRKYVFNDELLTPIVKNALGDSAGVLGAALLPATSSSP